MRYLYLLSFLLLISSSYAQLPQLVLQRGHTAPITAIEVSEDEQYALTGGWDRSAKLWELSTGKELRTYPSCIDNFSKMVLALNDDMTYFAVGSSSGSLKIIDIESGRILHILSDKEDIYLGLTFSKDGKELAAATSKGLIIWWDVETGNLIDSLALSHDIRVVEKGKSANRLFLGSTDGQVTIVNFKNKKVQTQYQAHTDAILGMALSGDEKLLVTSGNDGNILAWKPNNGELVRDIAIENKISVLALNDDGTKLLTGGINGILKLRDIETNISSTVADNIKTLNIIRWTGQQGILHNDLQELIKRPISDITQVQRFTNYSGNITARFINGVAFSPDSKNLASAGGDGTVRIFGENTGQIIEVGEEITCISYRNDGEMLAAGTVSGKVYVWMSESGKLVHEFATHNKSITELTFLDSRRIVSSSQDNTLKLLDFTIGKEIYTFKGHKGAVLSHDISRNKKYLLSGDGKGEMRLWNLADGKYIRSYQYTEGLISRVRFTPDSYFVLAGCDDGFIRIWDAESGDYFYEIQAHDGMVLWMDFSPRGEYLVSSGGGTINDIHLWDVLTVEFFGALSGHTESVTTVDYSPNGRFVVSSSMDNSIKLWDVQEGDLLATIYTLGSEDWAIVSPEGMFDASPGAMELMHYVVNIEPIDLSQLKERYYEPDLLQKLLGYNPEPLRNVAALEQVDLYPEVKTELKNFKYDIKLTPRTGGIGKVSFFINNKEILEDANLERNEHIAIDLTMYSRFLQAGSNDIGIKVYNEKEWLSSRMITSKFDYVPPQTRGNDNNTPIKLGSLRKTDVPNFYGLIVGTSDYRGAELDLSYADKDASDIASALKLSANMLFGKEQVNIKLLNTSGAISGKLPSKYEIVQQLQIIAQKATAKDILFIYLSGHGITYDGQFYYLTKDLASGDLTDEQIRNSYAISTAEFTEIFKNVPANKQILIIDACSSGSLVEDVLSQTRNLSSSQRRALDRMKDRTGMFILAGSAANKVSYEASQFGQGLLTYSLLSGMRGAALREGEFIDIMQLFQYAADKVPEFARSIGGIQRPVIAAPAGSNSFDIGQVNDEVRAAIPLEEVKPLFVRSIFQEESTYDDPLELADLLDKRLADISADAASSNVIFVDVKKYPNAYAVRGRYEVIGNQVVLKGRIFRDRKSIHEFTVRGRMENLEGLLNGILAEMEEL